jgi:copper homeostasis protein
MNKILELAVFNIQSALTAANGGADRIELCENYANGGTTPSYGILKTIREKVSIPAFVMICPRAGDFLYNDDEFEVIKKDILLCKQLGMDGVVVGILNPDGTIDKKRTSQLVEWAYPMEFTFHRAFDRCKDPLTALEDIIDCGCNRILTSGQVANVLDGKELIKQLIDQADGRITILPGGGLRSSNVAALQAFTGAYEFHTSAKKILHSNMQFINPNMSDELDQVSVDVDEIKKIKAIINAN